TRLTGFRAPSLSLSSLSRMASTLSLSSFLDDAHQVAHLVDHSTHRRGVGQRPAPSDLVQPEPDERRPLYRRAADRTGDLLDRDRVARIVLRLGHDPVTLRVLPQACASAAAPGRSLRRETISLTFLPRRAATMRGLISRFSASKVARTML